MCWLFHKWNKWRVIGSGEVERWTFAGWHSEPVKVQERECARCGKVERQAVRVEIR
jgi:hypothetical protein